MVSSQPDPVGAAPRGEDAGDLGLARPGLAFEEEWALQGQRKVERGREFPIGDVAQAVSWAWS